MTNDCKLLKMNQVLSNKKMFFNYTYYKIQSVNLAIMLRGFLFFYILLFKNIIHYLCNTSLPFVTNVSIIFQDITFRFVIKGIPMLILILKLILSLLTTILINFVLEPTLGIMIITLSTAISTSPQVSCNRIYELSMN